MMYAYPFTLARRAVIATLDLSARNLHLLRRDHWLSNPSNVTLIWLAHPAFGDVGAVGDRDPATEMRQWSVSDVEAFFESRDAASLGRALAESSVDGEDLLTMTLEQFHQDLRLTPFGARKVWQLRQNFLTSTA
eukprot:389033-Karenia_brevis.AAC.1